MEKNVNKQDKKDGKETIKRTEKRYRKQEKAKQVFNGKTRRRKSSYTEEKELLLETERGKGRGGE